jgi:hypothetical protein
MSKTFDDKILELARRETSVENCEKFMPITKGPIVAFFGISVLGAVSLAYLGFQKIRRLFVRNFPQNSK